MRERLEYGLVWSLLHFLGVLPRRMAHSIGIGIGLTAYLIIPRLRRVGMRNLSIAFPEASPSQRRKILRAVYVGLGRQLSEFCLFPRYTSENVNCVAVYDGFENFENARRGNKGVLLLTGHFGGWEIGSFAHSVYGYPIKIVVRDLDNPYVNALVKQYRTFYGNETLDKEEFARGLLAAMRSGQTVGILTDTNMTPPQGVFVDFFGKQACTASGVARVALKTGAAVVPAFTLWDETTQRYRIRFDPQIELLRSGNDERDAVSNTAVFTKIFEEYARRYPDQWLWMHRRWKTRPSGEPPVY
jgi:Kdo2-lipid IVA lauroyltransferase/acyltransferase